MQLPQLKRKTPQEMFESVAAFEREHGPGGAGRGEVFFVVPRLHACIQATPKAVDFYFDVLHPRTSWRTGVVRLAFKAATRSRAAREALLRAGLVHSVYDTESLEGVRWSDLDVLLGEWQFTGAFSASRGTVSHVLTQGRYVGSLINEVEARRSLDGVVRLPHLHGAWLTGAGRGWTEDTVFGSPPAESRPLDEAQRMMLRAYEATREEVGVNEYLDRLTALADERYAEAPPHVKEPVDALLAIARASAAEADLDSVALARCHGDLNKAQMVGPPEAPVLIDWSESEVCSVFHDLVYSSARFGQWQGYTGKKYPDEFGVLRDALQDEMRGMPGTFASALVFAEAGVKQHVDHSQERGSWRSWSEHVSHFIEAAGGDGAELRSVSRVA